MDHATRRSIKLAGHAPRVDRYVGSTCSVDGCTGTCRALSRYCRTHASQQYRTRNPTGRMPRRGELIPYRDRAAFALEAFGLAAHPAIVAAEKTLEQMIARPGDMPEPYARHWRRLSQGGATGRGMLLEILAVFGLRHLGVRDVFADDPVFFACLGSRFLRSAPLGWKTTYGGKRDQVRLPGLEAEAVGRALALRLGGLPILFWNAVEREDQERAVAAMTIRQALESKPL